MLGALRSAARRLLGVTRTSTYYLPWIARPGLRCVLILNNVESRFTTARAGGPFPAAVVQYDARGTVVARYDAKVPTATEPLELPLDAIAPRRPAALDLASLAPAGSAARVLHLRFTGNAWFNLYLVGAGPNDLAGPLSLMHVK